MKNFKEKRPWGTYENILEEEYCKVKKIVIEPEQSPSYQYHFRRSEIWCIVKGVGEVTLDDKTRNVTAGDVIKVPIECKHRIKNIGTDKLIFIEIQNGDYFGEDDIVRLEDMYGRAQSIDNN